MDHLTQSEIRSLNAEHQSPCVSIYMSTHPGGAPEDSIRFRKLLGLAEEQLIAAGMRGPEAKSFLKPLETLREDATFWLKTSKGLAAFLADGFLRVYRLNCDFSDRVEVCGLFQITPLLPLIQGDGRFYVLGLSQNHVKLWRGSRDSFKAIELAGVPSNIEEALHHHDRDEVLTSHGRKTSSGRWGAIFEGHGVGVDDYKDDLLRYFQAVDRGLQKTLHEETAPLVVASVEYLLPIYRKANSYRHLVEEGVHGNPDRVSEEELHYRAWAIVNPTFSRNSKTAVELYHRAAAHGRAKADVNAVVSAAVRGEIETLLVAEGAALLGTLDLQSGAVTCYEQPSPGAVDLVNLAAAHTLRHGNKVFVLPSAEMPVRTPLAAIDHLPVDKHGKGR